MGGFNEYSSQEISQTLSSFNNETVFHGDNLVAQPNKVRCILGGVCIGGTGRQGGFCSLIKF